MIPTSQNPGHRFPFSSGHNAMDNRTLYVTLAVSVGVAFVFTLLLYFTLGGEPTKRFGFGFLVSFVPALGVLAVIKLTRLLLSRLGVVFIYAVLFVLVVLLQAVGRLIPVNS